VSSRLAEGLRVAVEAARRIESEFKAVERQVSRVDLLVDGVTTASQQQREGLRQITVALGQLDLLAQSNASSAEASAASSVELGVHSDGLSEAVGLMQAAIGGRRSHASFSAELPESLTNPQGTGGGQALTKSIF
jgi:methyl-accepting chemotaxis protein